MNVAPPRDALRADSKGAPLKPRPRAGKEPASHAPERAEKVLAEETVSAKAWWAEFEDQDGGRGLGLSRRDMGQQGAEERRQSRPRRALLASAQRPAVGGGTRKITMAQGSKTGTCYYFVIVFFLF